MEILSTATVTIHLLLLFPILYVSTYYLQYQRRQMFKAVKEHNGNISILTDLQPVSQVY